MSDNLSGPDIVKAFLGNLVNFEVSKLLPFVAHIIPGVPGQMLANLLEQPEVQAKLKEVEGKAIDAVVDFLVAEEAKLKAFVASHVHGTLATVANAVLDAQPPASAHLSADDVRLLALLASKGDLTGWLKQLAQDLGLLPTPVAPAVAKAA